MKKEPNYYRIFEDLIRDKFPDKARDLITAMPTTINSLDVIELNERIFKKANKAYNQRLKSYDANSVKTMLEYQQEYGLNNSEMADLFRLSRNTITKWKRAHQV